MKISVTFAALTCDAAHPRCAFSFPPASCTKVTVRLLCGCPASTARDAPRTAKRRNRALAAASSRGPSLGCPYIFHRDEEAIGDFRKLWRRACTAIGLAGHLGAVLHAVVLRGHVFAERTRRVGAAVRSIDLSLVRP